MKFLRLALYLALPLIHGCSQNAQVRVGSTEFCPPKRYFPQSQIGMRAITHIVSHNGEFMIRIPAAEVQENFPAYVSLPSARYRWNGAHDLQMVVSPSPPDFSGLAIEAWNARTSGMSHRIDSDVREGYTKIIVQPGSTAFWWHMTRSPPPESGNTDPPAGWYVAPCQAKPDSYACTFPGQAGEIGFSITVDQANMGMRDDLVAYAKERLQFWMASCDA